MKNLITITRLKNLSATIQTIFRVSFLRNILFVVVIVAIYLPLFERLYNYPRFHEALLQFTENDAVFMATFLSRGLTTPGQEQLNLSPRYIQSLQVAFNDFNLEKIKIFDATGRIIYSTSATDIGKINTYPYFHNIVAKGRPYTKMINKNQQTLEGRTIDRCVVESYHPIMSNDRFLGAFELYYDITPRHDELTELINSQTISLGLGSLVALSVALLTLLQAARITRNRDLIRIELEENEKRLRLGINVIKHAQQGIVITGTDNTIVMVNPAFSRITGYSQDEALGKNPSFLQSGRHESAFYEKLWTTLHREGHWEGEVWNRRKDGGIFPEQLHISAIYDNHGQITHYVAIFSDISLHKENEEQLQRMAFSDPLTGLANPLLFRERLNQALKEVERLPDQKIGILYLDLDHFKEVNDTHGHPIGDQLLQQVADRLTTIIRKGDTVARLGGDEFAIILTHISGASVATHVAEKIIDNLSQPLLVGQITCAISTSIGIALSPEHGTDPMALINMADTAMYEAKKAGRNCSVIFPYPA